MSKPAQELEELVRFLEQRVAQLERHLTLLTSPMPPIFLGRCTNRERTLWVERTANNGRLEDFPDGRRSTVAGDVSNLNFAEMVNLVDTFLVLEVEDDGAYRYVPIGIGRGQYQYMVFQMVTQNVPGWDFERAHGIL